MIPYLVAWKIWSIAPCLTGFYGLKNQITKVYTKRQIVFEQKRFYTFLYIPITPSLNYLSGQKIIFRKNCENPLFSITFLKENVVKLLFVKDPWLFFSNVLGMVGNKCFNRVMGLYVQCSIHYHTGSTKLKTRRKPHFGSVLFNYRDIFLFK